MGTGGGRRLTVYEAWEYFEKSWIRGRLERKLLCSPQALFVAARWVWRYLMWQRLSALALCGTLALGADMCQGLPIGPPNGSNYADTPRPLAFRLSVKPGGPAFRITVRPLLFDWQSINSPNPVRAGEIEVARCQDGARLQLIPIMAMQPIDFAATFGAQDINFDGYLDFSVLTEFAAKFGSSSYWVYDPDSGLFVQNELTHELGENCLGAAWHGGCWKAESIEFDPKKHEISTHYFTASPLVWEATGGASAAGCPLKGDRYRVKNDRLILIHKEEITQGEVNGSSCAVTVSDLIAGTMRVTAVRRWRSDAREQPVK